MPSGVPIYFEIHGKNTYQMLNSSRSLPLRFPLHQTHQNSMASKHCSKTASTPPTSPSPTTTSSAIVIRPPLLT